jgi:hypothetical protein
MKHMTRTTLVSLVALTLAGMVLVGCDADNTQTRYGRTYLKGGKKVPSNLVGWVAVPGSEPKVTDDKNAAISYAVLSSHNIVPGSISGWVALKPALFAKMSGIKIDAPADNASELYVLNAGARIPLEMSNWVAVPNTQPQVESSSSKKDVGLAKLYADNVIPKELNGWIAVNPDTLAKLSEKYMMTGKGARTSKE